jgi:hypothetical protein
MDGTLAALFFLIGLGDMTLSDCPTGCLAVRQAPARATLQWGEVQFQDAGIGHEAYGGYDLGRTYGPFQPTAGVSVTDEGAAWAGIGAKWTSARHIPGPLFLEASFMPGFYVQGDGPDLGGALHFRSAIGLGYAFDNGATLTLLYDHRSNGDTQVLNPGLETLGLRVAFTF